MPRGRKSQDRHNSVAETLPPGYYETQGQWRVVQTGRKQFVGCLDRNHNRRCDSSDTSGELRLRLPALDQVRPQDGPAYRRQVHQPITSGTRDFAGARGVVTVHDALSDTRKSLPIKEKSCSTPSTTNQSHLDRAAPMDPSSRKHERSAAESEPA